MPPAVFYAVADSRFFVGAVALINSLRLTGNAVDVVILDHGLTADERRFLERGCTVVSPPGGLAGNPLLLKPFPHVLGPTGIVAVIDSDVIVTEDLGWVLEKAAEGRICAFPDYDHRRFVPDWPEAFGLEGGLRRQTYVSSGFVVFSVERWPHLLERWWQLSTMIPAWGTRAGGSRYEDPYWDGDQDALNAVLMSETPPEALFELPRKLVPSTLRELRRTRIVELRSAACTHRGRRCLMLHKGGSPKPWERGAALNVRRNAFTRLLPRVLSAPDVALPLPPESVPIWLRRSRGSRAVLSGLGAANGLTRGSARTARRYARRLSGQGRRVLGANTPHPEGAPRDRHGPRAVSSVVPPPGPLLVVSPHADDAALSCGALLARPEPVDGLTVMLGAPRPPVATGADRGAGFADSDAAVAGRRREDEAVFADGPHRLLTLDLREAQYLNGEPRSADDAAALRDAVREWVRRHPRGTVVLPVGAGCGLGFLRRRLRGRMGLRPGPVRHPDHLYVRDTALASLVGTDARVLLYEELPYLFGRAGDRQAHRVARQMGCRAVGVDAPVDRVAKALRIGRYPSQIPNLREDHPGGLRLDTAGALPDVERYWWLLP